MRKEGMFNMPVKLYFNGSMTNNEMVIAEGNRMHPKRKMAVFDS